AATKINQRAADGRQAAHRHRIARGIECCAAGDVQIAGNVDGGTLLHSGSTAQGQGTIDRKHTGVIEGAAAVKRKVIDGNSAGNLHARGDNGVIGCGWHDAARPGRVGRGRV